MGHEFKFETISYATSYSYCHCPCAFEHEYFDYITASGSVNNEVYERIVQSVVNGRCSHVTDENDEYVRETGIYGIHLAAVLGTKEALIYPRYQFNSRFGRLFGLNPYMIALYKENHEVLLNPVMLHFTPKGTYRLLDARRSGDDSLRIIVQSVTILEYCVRRKNIRLLKNYIKLNGLDAGLSKALNFAFQYRLDEFVDVLLKDRTWFRYYDNLWTAGACCELAIIYDHRDVLDKLLNYLYSVHYDTDNATDKLPQICHALAREKCAHVLTKYGIHKKVVFKPRDRVVTLLNLLCRYHDDINKDGILNVIKSLPNVPEILNTETGVRQFTYLHKYIDRRIRKPNVFKDLLSLGADINIPDLDGRTPLIQLLKQRKFERPDRVILEMFISENPDESTHHSAVMCALEQDARQMTAKAHVTDMNEILSDAVPHSLFGYDEEETYALNFNAPLLIECGFSYRHGSEHISMFLDSPKGGHVHATEYTYLQKQLYCPRSLLLICRDRLRSHFKGRSIQMFVESLDIPVSVKNFILLKNILRCLSHDMLFD